ncbi:MAG TPA: arginine--tRNA ligase [Acidiferrobacteraceae bacterium]|nr:arginine--tRNA ligase [Acidiferrobacteraceae bacterium]
MKHHLHALLDRAMGALENGGQLAATERPSYQLDRSRQKGHGDFACNIAMMLAATAKRPPREIAQLIVDMLPASKFIDKVEIAGPGFINFYLTPQAYLGTVATILRAGSDYGCTNIGVGKKVLLEYVSANPTGPLHVGHGRGAAYGDALARVLKAAGYKVDREYYVNDAGRQMDIIATSVWLRYLDLCGESFDYPANAYQGDYIWDIAATVHREKRGRLFHGVENIFSNLNSDNPETYLDGIIARSKQLLGDGNYCMIFDLATDTLLENIRQDLKEFGVEYDRWFSERSLITSGAINKAIVLLKKKGHLYEEGGAWWFNTTALGDEKDRVVVRDNGSTTYFASDIAYHLEKFGRGYDQLINIWGADHHGYVARVKAAIQAMGQNDGALDILLVQFAVLYRGKEKVPMSTRSGEFVTLRELRKEVGNDAARFFYVSRKCEQHMDFDLELAKSQSSDNPVYYVQYAHARIMSVYRQMQDKGLGPKVDASTTALKVLTETHEQDLLTALSRFPEVVEQAARNHEPHQIAYYLRDLANGFHTYYNAHQFIVKDKATRNARLALIAAVKQVISTGLNLIGVSAPDSM